MSQIQNQWEEIERLESQLKLKISLLGLDWHNEAEMAQLAAECKTFGPQQLHDAYRSHDRQRITRAEFFALTSVMLRTMEIAALDLRKVHGGEVWQAYGKHLTR